MGQAAEAWDRLSTMYRTAETDGMEELYAVDALYLEPWNPPHRGNLLIVAYLKDYLGGKDTIDVESRRVIESEDGRSIAVEWTISYDAAGRRWNAMPRASFLALDDDGLIEYHRDYS